MVSDLKIKISDVLGKYLSDVPMPQDKAIALVDELANLLSAQSGVHPIELSAGEFSATWKIETGNIKPPSISV